jgi:hypothetical protein
MERSESIKELAAALAVAQGEMKNPSLDSTNPHFKSKYASLASVRDAVIPVLAKYGLSISQHPVSDRWGDVAMAGCETVLMHASGEWLKSVYLMPLERPNAHGFGSCLTYARRYSLMAICAVVGDEDDDANATLDANKAPAPSRPYAASHSPTDGSVDALSPEDQAVARSIANTMVDFWGLDTELAREQAYATYHEKNLSNEMKLAVWEILRPHSSLRSRLKRMHEAKTAKNVTTMTR